MGSAASLRATLAHGVVTMILPLSLLAAEEPWPGFAEVLAQEQTVEEGLRRALADFYSHRGWRPLWVGNASAEARRATGHHMLCVHVYEGPLEASKAGRKPHSKRKHS